MDLAALERYYDAAPRRFAQAERVGPFTLFVGPTSGWAFYARPSLGGSGPFDVGAVRSLLTTMAERDLPLALEWVHDVAPDLIEAVRADARLTEVEELPLMVLAGAADAPEPPAGFAVRMLGPGDGHLLASVNGVQAVAFDPKAARTSSDAPTSRAPGTAERDAAARAPSEAALALLADGTSRVAVAEHPEHGVVAAGRHIPVGDVTEVVGVAVLPAFGGQGLGSAVTATLVADAAAHDVATVFLTASTERVARLYARLGFARVGTGYVAHA